MKNITNDTLPILYRPVRDGDVQVWLIGIQIGLISFSQTTKTYFINYKNISDVVVDFPTKKEVAEDVKKKVIEFIHEVIGTEDGTV